MLLLLRLLLLSHLIMEEKNFLILKRFKEIIHITPTAQDTHTAHGTLDSQALLAALVTPTVQDTALIILIAVILITAIAQLGHIAHLVIRTLVYHLVATSNFAHTLDLLPIVIVIVVIDVVVSVMELVMAILTVLVLVQIPIQSVP